MERSSVFVLIPSRRPAVFLKKRSNPTTCSPTNQGTSDTDESSDDYFGSGYDSSTTAGLDVDEDSSSLYLQNIQQVKNKKRTRECASKLYACTHAGCDKAYRKPSRLREHERSHTGEVSVIRPSPISDILTLNIETFHLLRMRQILPEGVAFASP